MGKKKPVQQTRRPSVGASSRIYSRDNVSRYSERARQRRRGKLIRRTIVCTLLAVLLCGVTSMLLAWIIDRMVVDVIMGYRHFKKSMIE